jgi:glutamyl-tRNA synthetase
MTVRTRFAPSPTGYLHVGGARTALFSWLHARKHGGEFTLRIEDTDVVRSTQESIDAILESLAWLGLDYDHGPVFQSRRLGRYAEVAQRLLEEDKAYHCYCSRERLETLRAGQMARKIKPRYDGHCRNLSAPPPAGVEPVIRFKNPTDGTVVVNDLIRGRLQFRNDELDDLIIVRANGSPTYNFTVVVDDRDMEITHVIRGDDHVNNTPRQMNILEALGAPLPLYAHVPMILGADGQRLSKRHGAVSVLQYRDEGYLPEAMLNHLGRLGWSYGDREIFSLDEMVELFEITDVNRAAASFNPEKLLWLNQHYIKTGDPAHVARHLGWHLGRLGIDPVQGPELVAVVEAQRERAKTLVEMAQNSVYFYREFEAYEEKSARKHLTAEIEDGLAVACERLAALPRWNAAAIHQCIIEVAEARGLKLGKLAQPLRIAVTGRGFSPPIDVTIELVGRGRTLARIEHAISFIRGQGA